MAPGASELVGRERELAWLDGTWDRRRANVATIVGPGGIGKTALVHEWRDRVSKRDGDLECMFEWTFHGPTTVEQAGLAVDVFLHEALRFFGAAEVANSVAAPWDKAKRLAELVGGRRALLWLDGLDVVDDSIAKLLADLARRNLGLCVVTAREVVRQLEGFGRSSAPCWQLEPLGDAAGADLLRSVFEPTSEDVDISRAARGHPLTLRVLGSYVHRALGDVRRWRELSEVALGPVLDAWVAWLGGNPPPEPRAGWFGRVFGSAPARTWTDRQRQLAVLELLTIFDGPADPGSLAALTRSPAITGLTEPLLDIDAAAWTSLGASLEQMGLVSRGEWKSAQISGYDEASGTSKPWPLPTPIFGAVTLDLHSLVREHLRARVRETKEVAWREGHARVYAHLCKSSPHWPEGLAGLLPLYQAVAHGCAAGGIQDACDAVYHARIVQGDRFYSHGLGVFGAELAAVAGFFERPWDKPSAGLAGSDQAWMLGQASTNLRRMGRLHEALDPMRVAFERRVALEQWKHASTMAINISELELLLGRTGAAIEVAEKAMAYDDKCDDSYTRIVLRTTLARARHQAGEEAAAGDLFEQSEAMQAERQPICPLHYTQRGRHYAEFLLGTVERAAWRAVLRLPSDDQDSARLLERCAEVSARANRTLVWCREQRWFGNVAMDHLTLGQAEFYAVVLHAGSLAAAREHIDAAIDTLRSLGSVEWLAHSLIARACLRHHATQLPLAHADLDEAWTLVERGPMPLLQADIQLARARLFGDLAALDHARELIARHAYGRRLPELADAELAAKSWPERVPCQS